MRKVVSMGMAAVLLAMALGGCATSNQKAESPAGTEAVSSQAEGETKEEKAESTEAGGEAAAETESGEAAAQEEYAVKPRQITDRKIKLGLIPVTMNTAYTMTINGAKKHIILN